jgi:hypothetical protein
MAAMSQVIVAKLDQISRFMIEEELSVAVDHLVLVLGAMINFAEWSPAARQSLQSFSGASQDHLAAMITTFTENHERMSEVSSHLLLLRKIVLMFDAGIFGGRKPEKCCVRLPFSVARLSITDARDLAKSSGSATKQDDYSSYRFDC